ncbi:hypothetical protein BH20ACT4_BH20ACT4_05710 [soil metagenome]
MKRHTPSRGDGSLYAELHARERESAAGWSEVLDRRFRGRLATFEAGEPIVVSAWELPVRARVAFNDPDARVRLAVDNTVTPL